MSLVRIPGKGAHLHTCGCVVDEGRSQDKVLHGGARDTTGSMVNTDGEHHSSGAMVIQGPA